MCGNLYCREHTAGNIDTPANTLGICKEWHQNGNKHGDNQRQRGFAGRGFHGCTQHGGKRPAIQNQVGQRHDHEQKRKQRYSAGDCFDAPGTGGSAGGTGSIAAHLQVAVVIAHSGDEKLNGSGGGLAGNIGEGVPARRLYQHAQAVVVGQFADGGVGGTGVEVAHCSAEHSFCTIGQVQRIPGVPFHKSILADNLQRGSAALTVGGIGHALGHAAADVGELGQVGLYIAPDLMAGYLHHLGHGKTGSGIQNDHIAHTSVILCGDLTFTVLIHSQIGFAQRLGSYRVRILGSHLFGCYGNAKFIGQQVQQSVLQGVKTGRGGGQSTCGAAAQRVANHADARLIHKAQSAQIGKHIIGSQLCAITSKGVRYAAISAGGDCIAQTVAVHIILCHHKSPARQFDGDIFQAGTIFGKARIYHNGRILSRIDEVSAFVGFQCIVGNVHSHRKIGTVGRNYDLLHRYRAAHGFDA